MGRNSSIVILVAVIVSAAGVAMASNPLLMGPSPGLAVNSSTTAPPTTTSSGSVTPLGTTGLGTTGSVGVTSGALSGTPAGTTGVTTGTATTGTATTGTTTTGTTTPRTVTNGGTTTSPTSGVTPGITATTTATTNQEVEQIVSLARTVQPGAPVSAITVPVGRQLVITDVIITNPGTTAACGAAVSATGGTTTPPLNGGTTTATVESGTGLLCVPAQTSLSVALTTGLEFASGQSVQLANTTPAANDTPAVTGPLHYHLRGFLVSTTPSVTGGGA
jgi:hypothetical protein